MRMNVGSVHSGVTACAPAGAHPQMGGVILLADENFTGTDARTNPRVLRVAFKA